MRRGLLILGLAAALQAPGAAAQPADSGDPDAIDQLLSAAPATDPPPPPEPTPAPASPPPATAEVPVPTPSPEPAPPEMAAVPAPVGNPPAATPPDARSDLAAAVFAAPQAAPPTPEPRPAAPPAAPALAVAAPPAAEAVSVTSAPPPAPSPSAAGPDLAASGVSSPQTPPPTAAPPVAPPATPALAAAPPPAAAATAITSALPPAPAPPPTNAPPQARPSATAATLASTNGATGAARGDSAIRRPAAATPPAALAAGPRGYQPSNPGLPYTRYQSVQRPTRIEETGISPDAPPTERDIAYESRVRGAFAASERSLGPLDGRWELSGPSGGLFAFQFADRSTLEGVWRDLGRQPGAVGALGLIDRIDRSGDTLTLQFRPRPADGPVTVTLQRQPEGDWRGEISGARAGEVRLRRN